MGAKNVLGTVLVKGGDDPLPINDPDSSITGYITAIDSVVSTPGGSGAGLSGASTPGSILAIACSGGESTWLVSFTGGSVITNYYFEVSCDSTNGVDGVWAAVLARLLGTISGNSLTSNSNGSTNTILRGTTAGAKWFRVRASGGSGPIANSPLITIRLSGGEASGLLLDNLPAGTQTIGAVTGSGTFVTDDLAAAATGAAAPANAMQVGADATSTTPAAATAGNLVTLLADLLGKLVVLPYALGDMLVSGVVANLATTTSTSCIAAPASGLRNYINWIAIVNMHATVDTEVLLQDGSGGTTIWRGFCKAAGGGYALALPAPLKQPTTATALFVQNVTTGSNVNYSLGGYKGP
jgi:hypothetical protein